MSTDVVIKAGEIPRIKHGEAMAIAAVENLRLWGLLIDIKPDEWATTHSDPFTLKLTGPAGGTYARDPATPGDCLEVDAIDCCRILSGRGTPVGVLHHPLLQ